MLFSNLLSCLRSWLKTSQRAGRSKPRCHRLEVEWLEQREVPAVDSFVHHGNFYEASPIGTALIETNVSTYPIETIGRSIQVPVAGANTPATVLDGTGSRLDMAATNNVGGPSQVWQ